MGIYNEYYQKYYSNMKKQCGISQYKPTGYGGNNTKASQYKVNSRRSTFPIYLNVMGKDFANIFIIQCIIVLVILVGLFISRTYPSAYINEVYDKGIAIIDNGLLKEQNINKEKIVQALKKENLTELLKGDSIAKLFNSNSITEVFNEMKSAVNFEENKEAYIKENYVAPVSITDKKQVTLKESRLLIALTSESVIKASFPGKVKSYTDGKEITLTIDYGDGVEIKYYGLSESKVKVGDTVDTGEILGKVNGSKDNILGIEVFYMGNILNPEKCFSFEDII